MFDINDMDDVERAANATRTFADVAAMLALMIDKIDNDEFEWSNSDLRSYLEGVRIAVLAFESHSTGEFGEILGLGAPRVLSEILSRALELD